MKNQYKLIDTLSQIGISEIKSHEPLKYHTSIGIGGECNLYITPNSVAQLESLITLLTVEKIDYYILGNGTNTLVSDEGYHGVIVSTLKLKEFRQNKNLLFFGAGYNLFEANNICQKLGYSGLEFSYGIPGSIGGAISMNAGAFGYSVSDKIKYVDVLYKGKIKRILKKDFGFKYRGSDVDKKHFIVLGAGFLLVKENRNKIELLQKDYFQKKLSSQPYSDKSFGSTFKRNLNNLPVSKIIDDLGLKGYSIGDVEISKKHAGFIVNKGNATCQDCLKLIKYIQKKVFESYGFMPELEVKLLGV